MSTIIIHSLNLKPAGKADMVIAISPEDDLRKKIVQLAAEIQSRLACITPGCFNDLRIICDSDSDGLQLGSVVTAQNVHEIFAPLKYKVGNITLLCSDGASNYRRGNNGMLMCSKLARTTYANVRASVSGISEGHTDILTWNQWGKIIMLERYENDELTETYHPPGSLLVHELKRPQKNMNTPPTRPFFDIFFLNKLFAMARKWARPLQQSGIFKHSLVRIK